MSNSLSVGVGVLYICGGKKWIKAEGNLVIVTMKTKSTSSLKTSTEV